MNDPRMLPPSMRPKKRYIIFEIISESPVEFKDFSSMAWNSFLSTLGEAHAAEARIWIIPNLYDAKKQKGVIRCGNAYVEDIRAALAMLSIVGESRAIIRVVGVTGTIKSAKEKYADPNLKQYA
ncbi:MAG: ribonuclease P protein component 2 [Candidatus Aenigmarchaeota archaeon]|nr:ribonuclease P protein component 2 [Candidatus Aenigmarchaeota archaeon]